MQQWAYASCRFISLLLLLIGFSGCEQYPKDLPPHEQVQAIIFEHLALDLFNGSRGDDQSLRLFLSSVAPSGSSGSKDVDPPKAVVDYLRSRFPSARPFSLSHFVRYVGYTEISTGHNGIVLRVPAVDISGDGPVVCTASYYVDGKNGARYEYRVQKVKGRWKVIDREVLSVS